MTTFFLNPFDFFDFLSCNEVSIEIKLKLFLWAKKSVLSWNPDKNWKKLEKNDFSENSWFFWEKKFSKNFFSVKRISFLFDLKEIITTFKQSWCFPNKNQHKWKHKQRERKKNWTHDFKNKRNAYNATHMVELNPYGCR